MNLMRKIFSKEWILFYFVPTSLFPQLTWKFTRSFFIALSFSILGRSQNFSTHFFFFYILFFFCSPFSPSTGLNTLILLTIYPPDTECFSNDAQLCAVDRIYWTMRKNCCMMCGLLDNIKGIFTKWNSKKRWENQKRALDFDWFIISSREERFEEKFWFIKIKKVA